VFTTQANAAAKNAIPVQQYPNKTETYQVNYVD